MSSEAEAKMEQIRELLSSIDVHIAKIESNLADSRRILRGEKSRE